MKPVVAIYSTFLQRAYDQLIHDVAIQNLPVVFALDRAGLVGADGATHAGAYDIAYLRCIPNMSVHGAGRRERVPADALHRVPAATTRPRCAIRAAPAPASRSQAEMTALPFGKGEIRREIARTAAQRQAASRSSRSARCSTRRSRRPSSCDGRQHALRQAARCRL